MSENRKLTSDVERSAMDHSGSRTVLLYFTPSFIALFVSAIILTPNVGLLIALGLANCVLISLIYLSLRLRKKAKVKTTLFSKSIKLHILSIFIVSIFVSPFIGIMNLNSLDEFIQHTPFNLISAIAFGYIVICFCLGIPVFFLYNAIKDRSARKQKINESLSQIEKNSAVENYDKHKHGKIEEEKNVFPVMFLNLSLIFALTGFFMNIIGIVMAFSPQQDTTAGIVCAVFGIPFAVIGIIMGFLFFTSRSRKKLFDKTVASFYDGTKAFITTGKIISWSRETIRTRGAAKYNVKIGYKIRYAFIDQNNKQKQGKGFIEKDSHSGYFFSVGIPEALSHKHAMSDFNYTDIKIVFNDKLSAILGIFTPDSNLDKGNST